MDPLRHLRGLRGWDLVAGIAFTPLVIVFMPIRAAMWVADAVRERWYR